MKIFFNCICKEKFFLISSFKNNVNINVCMNCHSFYTKKKKISDNSEKIKKFNKKYENFFK
ncbi:ribosomal protein L31 [Candidatus Carsonella ruddii HT isolate Thao2000]|uniref:50S ribosomal protein L31 n=1 Tax=Candidatus Carsonella ruddii HT isolate Thao2000 TaxID=1202539 RepID=J3TEE3_CARRU|nr:50S ribosomal protein L31 [Candidatus Carsonella ruddii]AFP84072.1 ribosomal protein L31 [Candidatus Carsonella ruddii HT isolate Thao2000]